MTFTALHFEFKIGKSTVGEIVRETCVVIWNVLRNEEMPEPTTEHWLEISNTFYSKTNFPNCLGAVDGKHIRIQNPKNTGSLFFNYKKYFSIILMAVVDANLSFVYIDVGSYGKESDSNIFKQSSFGKKLYSNALNIPDPKSFPSSQGLPQPYVFVGDEAFALHANLLRPYPQRGLNDKRRIFNYRLSRARRTVECAFGVLANKWRVFHTTILVSPDFVDDIIKSCCVLHNFVRKRDGYNYEDMESECHLDDIEVIGTGSRTNGIEVREAFAEYFVNEGAVPFQNRVL